MIEYKWNFPTFDVAKSEDGLTDVVKTIHWIYIATEGEYVASIYGALSLGDPHPNRFTPFDQITEQWTIEQLSRSLDIAAMEKSLAAQIEVLKRPPIVPMAPPF